MIQNTLGKNHSNNDTAAIFQVFIQDVGDF